MLTTEKSLRIENCLLRLFLPRMYYLWTLKQQSSNYANFYIFV